MLPGQSSVPAQRSQLSAMCFKVLLLWGMPKSGMSPCPGKLCTLIFFVNCNEMKFRGHQIKRPSLKISLSLIPPFVTFNKCDTQQSWEAPSLLWTDSLPVQVSQDPRSGLGHWVVQWGQRASCYLGLSPCQCSPVTTLTSFITFLGAEIICPWCHPVLTLWSL